MLQYLLLLCAFAVPDIWALAVPVIEATAEDAKCTDIAHCRTIWNIIWSCLITIFACTWVSIHRNLTLDSGSAINITALLDRVWITVLTILVPEYTLAWAVRQWIVAREIAKEFNKLSPFLPPPVQQRVPIDSGVAVEPAMLAPVPSAPVPSSPVLSSPFLPPPFLPYVGVDSGIMIESAMEPGKSAAIKRKELATGLAELWKSVRSKFSNDERWTTTHGFFVLMGGFSYPDGDRRDHPASRENLEGMIQYRLFEVPSKQDIDARSKSDAFSKTVTVLQTLWFVMQCIARAIQHLPITNLEIATLAYTTITFAMYSFWFQKPLNVSQPIRLTRPEREEPESDHSVSSESLPRVGWSADIKKFVQAVVGTQDDNVHLSELHQVPTFYAGKPAEHLVLFSNAMALVVGAIFGAIHCIAWSFAFPSQAEKLLWRISAVTTVAIPPFYVVFVVLIALEVNWLAKPVLLFSTVGIPCYLVARAVLLVLTFTTLRDLPPAAYETIRWLTFLPHI